MAIKSKKKSVQYASAEKRAKEHEDGGGYNTAVKRPETLASFSPKNAGVYRLDFMPSLAGKHNSHASEGSATPELTYFSHRAIGADEKPYICARKTFGKKCPVCEHQAKLRRDAKADPQAIKDLEPKERQLWIVKDLNNADAGYQLWDVSYHLFGKMLDAKIKAQDDDDGYGNYFHLESGMTVKVSLKSESMGTTNFLKTDSIDFKARKEDYEESVLEELPCLDDLIVDTPYDKLKKIFLQEEEGESDDEPEDDDDSDEDEDEDEKPAKKPAKTKAKAKPEPEDDDDDETEEEEPAGLSLAKGTEVIFTYKGKKVLGKIVKVNVGNSLYHVAQEGRENPHVIDFDEVKEAAAKKGKAKKPEPEDDDEEPAPKKKAKAKPVEEDDSDDDFDLDDDDDEPAPKKPAKKVKPVEDEDNEPELDDDDLLDDDEEEAPKKKTKFKPGKSAVPTDDDFDLDDDDDEPAPKKKAKK